MSINWLSLPPLELFSLLKVEPDDGRAIDRLLLSDVAGPWLAVALFELFCNFNFQAKQGQSKHETHVAHSKQAINYIFKVQQRLQFFFFFIFQNSYLYQTH